ncbi:MAG: Maf family protein [Cellvibrionaceae bacterium]
MTALYLASQSPRRRELLTQIGVQFEVLSVDVEEWQGPDESPADYVERLARDKSAAGWHKLSAGQKSPAPVMGADTIVVLGGQVLEKPRDEAHGIGMLLALSGQVHQVFTAVAVTSGKDQQSVICRSEVRFGEITPARAAAYWRTGEPCDKAGGYGIQGAGAVFVEKISGSYSAVVGLPLFETQALLAQFDIGVWQFEAMPEPHS